MPRSCTERPASAFVEGFELKVDLCDAISVRFDGGAVGAGPHEAVIAPSLV